MNVRFFGGRKEEYLSIPKHNPIGLYFCADTRELFLGDRLLSDGLRVVPTFADLPSISEHKAAEGVIYFVAATKNGYVLPRGGYDWLQVIYAPTSGEGAEVDLSNYYTKAEVDEAILKAIANIKIEVDLTGYATKEDVAAQVTQLSENIANNYVTNTTLEEKNYVTNQTLVTNYVSNEYIEQNYITTEQIAATYVTEEKVTEVVTNEVSTVVTEQIETKVTEVIQEKVDTGEIAVKAAAITYGEF